MKKLVDGIEKISKVSGEVASYLIMPLTLVVIYTVVMRRFFGNSPDWSFEVTIFIFGIMILLTGADILRTKGHIIVDVIQPLIKGKLSLTLLFIVNLIVSVTVFILLTKGIELAIESTKIREHSAHQTSFNPPIWWFKWFIPIAAFTFWLQSLAEFYKLWIREDM